MFAQGTAGWVILDPEPSDDDGRTLTFASPSPAFVDVNTSPQPTTVTSDNQHVTLLTMPATQTVAVGSDPSPPPTGFGATASIPNQSYQWAQNGYAVPVYVEYDGSNAAAASGTITVANNLTATDLFGNPPYTASMTYNIAILSAIPTAATIETSPSASDHSAAIIVTDFKAAQSGLTVPTSCLAAGGAPLASVSAGSMDTSNWQEVITVTATATGTCTFNVIDAVTGISKSITVTVPD